MNENINLCEILKGHEGETFYSPTFGELILTDFIGATLRFERKDGVDIILLHNGKWCKESEEISVFPSKDQRDWNKWIEEQKSKTPKTWSEFINQFRHTKDDLSVDLTGNKYFGWTRRDTPIEKSALALLKIHQLIEVGYGGLITNPNTYQSIILWDYREGKPYAETFQRVFKCGNLIRIKPEYAEEFLLYPENIQLLKDYLML